MDSEEKRLAQLIDDSDNIVFFGGAGVSTESGVPDFRSEDGLYSQTYDYPPEEMLSHRFYQRHKEDFFRFYRDKMLLPDVVKPNAAHKALAKLEQEGKLKAVITQNIDGLHQAAGSRNVVELHGSILRNYCQRCGKEYPVSYIQQSAGVPVCSCGGDIKPDVVLYGESLSQQAINDAVRYISEADLLIIGGTSLVVYPAASLVDYFSGRHLVVINKSPTHQDARADLLLAKPIGEVFSHIMPAEGECAKSGPNEVE